MRFGSHALVGVALGAVVAAGPSSARPDEPPSLHFSDPRLLEVWDVDARSPLSLVQVFKRIHEEYRLPVPGPDRATASTGAALSRFAETWGEMTKTLAGDLDRMLVEMAIDWEKDVTKTYLPDAAKTAAGRKLRGNGNVTRVFEGRWLSSPDGQFLLAGVVSRIDRKDFDPGSCGELRLIYRLGYEVTMEGQVYASRLPFTVNVVYRIDDDQKGCREVASRWGSGPITAENASAVAARLLEGPLAFSRLHFKQLEINAQVARFPSDLENVERRKFAGQAMYWMRIFGVSEGRFHPLKLENTPDVQALRADPVKRKELRAFIQGHIDEIDSGVFRLPDSLLADVALTWSTLGSGRLANKPFDLVLSAKESAALAVAGDSARRKFVSSGPSLLERLNGSSCMGCHQSSSTAGFHFLGVDRRFGTDASAVKSATDGNRLQLPFSPHFYSEIARRQEYVSQLAKGLPPNATRPNPSAPPGNWSESGVRYAAAGTDMPCVAPGKGELAPAASWTCDLGAGLHCRALATSPSLSLTMGQCAPEDGRIQAGLSCRSSAIEEHTEAAQNLLAYNVRSFLDVVKDDDPIYLISTGALTTTDYNCRPTRLGVPLGRVTRKCRPEESALEAFAAGAPPEVCAIVGGKGFEQMARGYFSSAKFAEGVGRGLLDTCSPTRFCREDYICQELPDFLAAKRFGVKPQILERMHANSIGFCTPTYFVYQLRLDGHPNPR